jgi:hypothetical protein
MKKIIVPVFLSLVVLVSMAYSAKKETRLTLHVKVLLKDEAVENLTKNDFDLLINGEKREIIKFFKKKPSLDQANLRRNFILAFNMTDYGQQITDGISYFILNILNNGDGLVLWTPIKIYQIPTDKDKKLLLEDIVNIVKRDTLNYKKDIIRPTKNLNDIVSADRVGSSRDEGVMQQNISNFLTNYSREFSNFKNRFILPNLMKIPGVAALLAEVPGEKWLIGFMEREIIPTIADYKKKARQIRDTAALLSGSDQANATRMYTGLNMIDKLMLITEGLPMQKITGALLKENISYNAVLFKNQKKSTAMGDNISPDYEGIFKNFSKLTGGITVINANLKEGLDVIRKNSNVYYDLIYKFNGKLEDKKIKVNLSNPNAKAYYTQSFAKSEIEKMIEPKITLSGFSLRQHILKFSISDFKKGAPDNKDQGIIRILVELIDQQDSVVFKTQNTLKSDKKSFSISLKIPPKHKGRFKVRISAFDLISRRSTQLVESKKL